MAITQIERGTDGRNRYTLRHTHAPDNLMGYYREPAAFPSNSSKNPATDTDVVEIAGITGADIYPVIQVNTNERTVTLTFDYTEAGGIYQWVKNFCIGIADLRSMSIIRKNAGGAETGRHNYYNCFPIEYQQISGFGQDIKLKERVVLSYDWDEEA